MNIKGAYDPRSALRSVYGIRHENTIQVHLMQLVCMLRCGLSVIMISSATMGAQERFKIALIAFLTMFSALCSFTQNPIPLSKFSLLKGPMEKFGIESKEQVEFKVLMMCWMLFVGIVAHMFEPGFITVDKKKKKE